MESISKINSQVPQQFERKYSTAHKPYFKLKAVNGEIILTSEMYHSDESRHKGVRRVFLQGFGLYDDFEIFKIDKKQKIEVTDKGLKLVEYNDEKLIIEKLGEYVDWLFKGYESL